MSGKQAKKQRQVQRTYSGRDWSALDVRMLRDDMEWIGALGASSHVNRQWESAMGLALLPQMARVVYEGMNLLQRKRPTQAKAVSQQFAAEIEASRHSVKLLDDTHKLYDGVLADFEMIEAEHSEAIPEDGSFAVTEWSDRLITTSRLATFQRATSLTDRALLLPPEQRYSHRLGFDIGRALPAILKQFGYTFPAPNSALAFPSLAPIVRTMAPSSYFSQRFDAGMSPSLMDVLTAIESTINAALFVFEPSAVDYPNPLFRCRLVTVTHAINALDEIAAHNGMPSTYSHSHDLDTVLRFPATQRLRELRALRNRSMHYGIPSSLSGLGPELPGYGLVEATSPGTSYEAVQSDIMNSLKAISDLLFGWGQP